MADDDGDTDAPYLGKPCDLCGESCEANQELCVPWLSLAPGLLGRRRALPARTPCGLTRPSAADRNQLSCSFPVCDSYGLVYHQDCIERYLKSIRLERCVALGAASSACPVAVSPPTVNPDAP